MTRTGIESLAAKAAEAAELLRAMSNEHRLLILCHLIAEEELSVGDIFERMDLSQSALSQHLAKLREQGLVTYRRDAQTLYYRVADPKAAKVLERLQELFCPTLGRRRRAR
jgi:ArsR family transcriptional regulator, virulence genes transcriptional regulator